MSRLSLRQLALSVVLGLTLGVGCNRSTPPPAALPLQEIPTAFERAFAKAKPDIKDLANQVVASVQAQDYSKAFLAVQNLTSRPGLTKDQASVATRATLTVNGLLQTAETKGDKQAAQTLRVYRSDK